VGADGGGESSDPLRIGRWTLRRWLALIALVLLVIGGRQAGSALVRSRPVAAPDAIVVLASHEWERLPEVAVQARRWPSAAVLLTRPRIVTEQNCHRCGERAAWLESLGVEPARVLHLAMQVGNTRDEALAALSYCRVERVRRLLIVTSPYHTRRALATFTHVFAGSGIEIGVEPSMAHSAARPGQWWRSAADRWYVRYEWSAIAFYLIRYGIIPGP
jgi:uncharacterized SAM-binding protein YcdF (DUF218 family)